MILAFIDNLGLKTQFSGTVLVYFVHRTIDSYSFTLLIVEQQRKPSSLAFQLSPLVVPAAANTRSQSLTQSLMYTHRWR
jgi:hypothetical protein